MAHGFLSYQDPRGEVDYLDKIYKAIKGYLDKREKREEKAERKGGLVKSPDPFDDGGPVEPAEISVDSPKTPPANPLKRALAGSALRRALPSAAATPTEVRGGALARSMGFAGNRVKPEGFVADQIIDVTAVPVNDNAEIVQAIDRLTFVTMNLLSAQKEQNAIAGRQQLFFEKLARKDKARLEESQLERAKDLSSNIAYKKSALQSGRGPAGLLPGAGGTSGSPLKTLDTLQTVAKLGSNAKGAAGAIKGGQTAIKGVGSALARQGVETGLTGGIKGVQIGANVLGKELSKPAVEVLDDIIPAGTRGVEQLMNPSASRAMLSSGFGLVDEVAEADKFAKLASEFQLDDVLYGSGGKTIKPKDAAELFVFLKEGGYDGIQRNTAGTLDVMETLMEPDDYARLMNGALEGADKPLATMLSGTAAQSAAKTMSKTAGKGLGKSLLKKIPVIAGLVGIGFGIQRALEGDFLGAGLEITSGLLGATGVGAGLSFGIDGFLLARDLGMMPMAKGGILTSATPVVAGEAGAEGFFPLEGTRGKKTFAMFGDGIIDAQKRRKKEVAQIQAEGFKLFSEDAQYMKVFDLFNPFKWGRDPENPEQPNTGNGRPWWDPLGIITGNGESDSRTPMVGPPPPIEGTDGVSMARSLIVNKEGFEEMPYWDVNAYRAGYGSDTYTTADGTVKRVQQGVPITRADADRDIDRRISTEFMPEARQAIGPDIWDKLPAAAQAALTSIAYNYGSVPSRVTRVAKSSNGNIEAIASAVEGLKNDDGGINSGRRQHEADMIRSSAGQAASSITPPAIGDQSSVSPAAAETGNPLSIASQQVSNAGVATQTPTIINNYYGGGSQTGGNMPADIAFGVSSGDMGNSWASELRLRTV
ncbi:MAG: hypothetical protein CL961_06955 [Euryarchaeota archaeon]|nr:hypothetical protein [Euryarchaeota archaeon]